MSHALLRHPPFSSLSSFSAKILHLRSYLSCACSCSIFMRRLMVSVLMPGLETFSSSNSIVSCCQIRTRQRHIWYVQYSAKQLFYTCQWMSHLITGKRGEAGLLRQPVLILPWIAAKLLLVCVDLYHLEQWLRWSLPCVSLWRHGATNLMQKVKIHSVNRCLRHRLPAPETEQTLGQTFSSRLTLFIGLC